MATSDTLVKPRGAAISSGRRQRILRDNLLAFAFIAPALILLCVFSFYPLFYALYISLNKWGLRQEAFVGFDNYTRMVTDPFDSPQFFNSLGVTIWYAIGTIPLAIAISLFLAYLLFQPLSARGIFRTAYFLPYVTSTVAAAEVWNWLFHPQSGFFNWILSWFGIGKQQWMNEPTGVFALIAGGFGAHIPDWVGGPSLALVGIILMTIWKVIGFNIIIFLAGLGNIPKELYEAARIDGANEWQLFWRVTWPLLTPTTFFIFIISTINSFKAFDQIYVMTAGGPLDTTRVVTMYIFHEFWERTSRVGYASAVAIILFLIILALTLFNQFVLSRHVHYE